MKEIKLHKGETVFVDDEDFEIVNLFRWHLNGGYARHNERINGKYYYIFMHHLIKNTPNGMRIDHINRNKFDNRKCNLRFCTHAQNQYNTSHRKQSKSQYKGVSWSQKDKKWTVNISKNGERKHIGLFHQKEAAAQAYNFVAKELFGKFAYLNPI